MKDPFVSLSCLEQMRGQYGKVSFLTHGEEVFPYYRVVFDSVSCRSCVVVTVKVSFRYYWSENNCLAGQQAVENE